MSARPSDAARAAIAAEFAAEVDARHKELAAIDAALLEVEAALGRKRGEATPAPGEGGAGPGAGGGGGAGGGQHRDKDLDGTTVDVGSVRR
jgi:hypothetical protein